MADIASLKRRQILSGLMKLLGVIAFIFISIPFISSFSTKSMGDKKAATSHWIITSPVTDLMEGKVKAFPWSGGIVWVYSRTVKDIQLLTQNKNDLRDAISKASDQPEQMKNHFRSASKKYFVFIPQETKRGCQVSLNNDSENTFFTDPCFNAKYDTAGRIFKNSGNKEQQNLPVPEHAIEDGILKIGIWQPKI